MELFLFRHAEYARLYNCSAPDVAVSAVPLAQRQHFWLEAWASIGLCALYYLLYLPCMCSIWRQHRQAAAGGAASSCYTLLFYIGLLDMGCLWVPGFLHGWLALDGAVFCSYPTAIYLCGCFGLSMWIAESTADLILAINRCLLTASPWMAQQLFGGLRTYIWLALCTGYAFYWLLFQRAMLFSAVYFAWFFDPFIGYRKDVDQEFAVNSVFNYHDSVVALASPATYLLFAIIFAIKTRAYRQQAGGGGGGGTDAQSVPLSNAEKMTFLQVFIISAMNTICASSYMLLQHITPDQWMVTVAHFTWFHIHGFPPVIYLCLNRTIRNDCRQLLARIVSGIGGNNRVQDATNAITNVTNPNASSKNYTTPAI